MCRLPVERPARGWKQFVKAHRRGALGVVRCGLNLQAALTQKLKTQVLTSFDRFIGQKRLVAHSRCVHQTQQALAVGWRAACAAVLGTDIHRGCAGQLLFVKNVFELGSIVVLKENIVPVQFKAGCFGDDRPGDC